MKRIKPFQKNITNQFLRLMGLFVIVFIIGFVGFQLYQQYSHKQYVSEHQLLMNKHEAIEELDWTFTYVFFNMRGYYAFDNTIMRDHALEKKEEITGMIELIKEGSDTNKDLVFLSEAADFFTYYFEVLVPEQLHVYEEKNRDMKSLPNQQDGTERITNFQKSMEAYNNHLDDQIQDNMNVYDKKIKYSQWLFSAFFCLMLLVLILIIRLMLKRLGKPLHELAIATEEISMGREVDIPQYGNREDEVGMLSRSFQKMIKSIQENEQHLLAQNEELIAQQDELQSQQEELLQAVETIQSNEANLQRRNDLMNTLSNSLDKKAVLKSIVENICRIMNTDRGIITLFNSKREYAALGLSLAEQTQFIQNLESGMITRLHETKNIFTIKRKCTPIEKGYHTEELSCFDLYVPVISAENEIIAVMVFSRYTDQFTYEEMKEYEGIAKQITITLEKIKIFEELESERALIKDVVDTIHEGLQIVDDCGVILHVNSIMSNLFSTDSEMNMINMPLEKWNEEISESIENGPDLFRFMKTVISGKAASGARHIYLIKSPVKRVIQIYFEELYNGDDKYGTLFVHRDITKEHEVDQMKSEFVSTVSHELRTPLASVLGFTELMLNKTLKPERQQKYLQTIYQEGKRLTALINDFLDVQRMESGKQTYEKKYEDIIQIIDRVVDNYRIHHPHHTFIVKKKTENTSVLGDYDKLTQVYNNLLSNAVKYSPDGGEIVVKVYEKDSTLYVDIVDHGLGIPEDALPNIFTKFYRVDNSDRRKIGGTGLGLSIVNEIMVAHDGGITVTSELKKGSTFTLNFPLVILEKTATDKVLQRTPVERGANGVNVIVIEDDKNLALLLLSELEDNGFHVLQYMNGDDGMGAIKEYKPDTIVLDIMLDETGLNGWEILEKVKHDPDLKDIPIIISSALEEKEKGFSLGATEYLVKPYPPHKLSSTILQTLLKKEKTGQILVPDRTTE